MIPAGTVIGPYRIEVLLGEGGAGVVYHAVDTRLNRAVAIKLLSNRTADAAARQRFLREAQTASGLNHPNILTVYDIGEWGGRDYIVTEFAGGGTLRDWSKRQRRTPEEISALLAGVGEGLAAAHEAGILHRDIKPGNILLTSAGYAKLADFGVAKLLHRDAPARDDETLTLTEDLTQMGVIIGTVAYMSPEQALAKPLDGRSDIFSFGIVLHELLSGERPFTGNTHLDVLKSIASDPPKPLRADVPQAFRAIVEKALEKRPGDRYQSARDVAVDLRRAVRGSDSTLRTAAAGGPKERVRARTIKWIGIAAAFLLAAAIAAWMLLPRPVSAGPIRSIAVLPFENLSHDPEQDFFSDGITGELISGLSQVHALRVISRTTAMRYKGSGKPIPDIGRELAADAVVEGSVQRAGGRVRVSVRLIRAASDSNLWSRDYDQDLADVLQLESDVGRAIAREIRIQVTPEEQQRLAAARKVNPQAEDEYLAGRALYETQNPAELDNAAAHLRNAIRLQPDYAPAYAELSLVYQDSGASKEKYLPDAQKALELDPNLSEAHSALAGAKELDWDWAGAEAEYKRALELNPASLDACGCYADMLAVLGRFTEAEENIRHALGVNPLSPFVQEEYGFILYQQHRFEDALLHFRRALELEPRDRPSRLGAAFTNVALGKSEEALALVDGQQVPAAALAYVYAALGRRADAQKELMAALSDPRNSRYLTALAYFRLGENEKGFEWLQKSADAHEENILGLKFDPAVDPLRGDPRLEKLIARLKIPK